jgi:hypothetical protein
MLEMNFKKIKIKKRSMSTHKKIKTVRNGTERYGTERNGTVRNGTERNGTVRNGTEMNVYLVVDGKAFDTLVVALTTQQKFNQIIDGSPLRYQQTFVLRLHIRK